jgi:phosphoglycolate phosphatase
MQFTQIIFDLDGTLSDPEEGIKNSLEYAIKNMKLKVNTEEVFPGFIGPPLHEGFSKALHLNREDTEIAVRFFREYYGLKGLFENTIYPGIRELLKDLHKKKIQIHLATSKLEHYAIKVLEYHQILRFFSTVAGATYKGKGAAKKKLIRRILELHKDSSSENFLMVGDKKYDVLGAKAEGIKCLGVLYGYGTSEELVSAGADYLVNTVGELRDFLLKL